MSAGTRLVMIAVAGALAVVAPAAAKPPHPAHPSRPAHPSHPAHPGHRSASHKCAAHKVAYVASGQLSSWTATQTGTGTWTGTITVHVTRSNHHAAGARGGDVTYTLSNTQVTFGNGANPPAAGDPVHVIGKVSELAKKCSPSGFAPTITLRKVNIDAMNH
jgi:hypothetical protein